MQIFSRPVRRHAGRLALYAWGLWGCTYPLERTAGLGDGEIRLTPRRADGSVAVSAVASVNGSARVAAVRPDVRDGEDALVLPGLFAGRWLVRVSEDDNQDGIAERGLWIVKRLDLLPIPKSLNDGCAGQAPRSVVNTEILGDVVLEETAALDVTVEVDAGDGTGPRPLGADEQARVVVWRDLAVDGASYATSVENSAQAANSATRLEGILAGPVHVAVFVHDQNASPSASSLYGVADVALEAGARADLALVASLKARTNTDAQRAVPVSVEVQWDLSISDDADVSQANAVAPHPLAPQPTLDIIPPQSLDLRQLSSGDAPSIMLPIGISNLLIGTPTDGLVDGAILGVVIAPPDPDDDALELARVGPVELPATADPCAPRTPDAARDCDNDGLADDGDSDLDGDGQDDDGEAAEAERCLAPGLGTDIDGDGLCEPAEDTVDGA